MNYKNECRTFLTDWYGNMELLSLLVPIKDQKKAIGRYRKLLTQPEKYYPTAEEMRSEFVRYDLKKFAQTVIEYKDDNPTHMDVGVYRGRLENLCTWPKFMRDTYEQRNPKLDKDGRPMMDIQQYWDFSLKEAQTNKTSHTEYSDAQVEMDSIDSKKFKNKYKKYVKEWNKKND